jgi:hypothetical protein
LPTAAWFAEAVFGVADLSGVPVNELINMEYRETCYLWWTENETTPAMSYTMLIAQCER